MYLGPTGDQLPAITEAKRLRLRPGDSLVVRLDGEPSVQEAREIADYVRSVVGVPVLVLGPGQDVEVIAPEADGEAPELAVQLDGNPDDKLFRWLQAEVRRRGGVAAVFG